MVPEGTPGKYVLWAQHPERRRPVTQTYSTIGPVEAARITLEADGYSVVVTLAKLLPSD
jgi:hypothetical protein